MTITKGPWYEQQRDAVADALHEIMTGANSPEEAVAAAEELLADALDSWLVYFEKEAEKWESLKMRLRLTNRS